MACTSFWISRSTTVSSCRPWDSLARCSMRRRFNSRTYSRQNSSNKSRRINLSFSAESTRSSSSCRLDGQPVRAGAPGTRARSKPTRSRQYTTYPPPHSAHFASPENRNFRPARLLELRPVASIRDPTHVRLPGLRSVPELVVDDAQERNVLGDPLLRGVETRDPPAGIRVLHVPQAIPDQAADVEFVVKDSRAAFGIAVDRARTPGPAGGTCDALGVQLLGDRLRGDSGAVVAKIRTIVLDSSATISRSPVLRAPLSSFLVTR